MGAEVAAGGGGSLPGFLGRKNRYARVDDVLPQEPEDGGGVRVRGGAGSCRRYVFACSVFASLNHILLGYDVGAMSGCIIFIQRDKVLVGCLSFISLLGSLAAGRTSDAIGRKWTIGLAAAVFQGVRRGDHGASAVLWSAHGGAAAGRHRDRDRHHGGARVHLGDLPGDAAGLPGLPPGDLHQLRHPHRVRLQPRLRGPARQHQLARHARRGHPPIVPSISIAFVLLVIPESPRWLVMKGQAGDARAVLVKVSDSEEAAEERLAEIEEAARATATASGGNGKEAWRELLRPSPVTRRMLVTGLGVQFFQQATGIDALVYYSPTIFRDSGITTESQLLGATVTVGVVKTVFIVIAIVLVDRVGRKPLLYVSTAGMTACLALLAASLSLLKSGALPGGVAVGLAILTVCGFVAFFSVGMGPINMVLSSEIYPLRLRAQAVAAGFALNRMASGAVAMSFLSICRAVTVAGAFAAFAAVSALSVAFVHLCVPETSGKTLEEIESLFGGGGVSVAHGNGGAGEVELGDAERLEHKRLVSHASS
ncbi:unnamed protein product [Miscanthus lutarioriparius]|uniref:Major facilitator superfamily (MFS) profile domain-containing protein n=1 Tax=Miscanthus lutarioriparius TaxID=422564 RepID=A0A811QSF4_9POAL|nr:unnamed protein product [Miscanthus lutarioriparius]